MRLIVKFDEPMRCCFVHVLAVALFVLSVCRSGAEASDRISMRQLDVISTDSLFAMGERAIEREELDKAMEIFTLICSRDDGKHSRELFSRSYQRKGYIHYCRENYAEAMQCYLQARGIAERDGLSGRLAPVYISIGNVFSSTDDLESGIMFYRKALASLDPKTKDPSLPIVYNNLFYAYYLKSEADSARKYYALCRDLEDKDKRSRYDLLLNSGLLDDLLGNHEKAVGLFHRAASYARNSLDSREYEAAAYSMIAKTYEKIGQTDSVLKYLHVNEEIARTNGYNSLLVESLRDLARVYEGKGLQMEALQYKSDYLALSDSLFSRETLNMIKNSQALYEQNKDAYTIRTLNTANALQRNWIITLFVVVGIIVFLLAILWIQKRKLGDAYRGLYERNLSLLGAERRYADRISALEEKLTENESNTTEGNAHPDDPQVSRKLLITKEQRSELLGRILKVMESPEFYCNSDCNIDRLAAAIDSNSRYVSEVLNEEYGMNFRAFLNRYRIKEAMFRLEDHEKYGNLTIKAIAESVGYKSQATFISVFTKETGLKPSMYRQLSLDHRDGD